MVVFTAMTSLVVVSSKSSV